MAGINVPFLSNVRDFLRGTSSVEDSLDDVADALDDVADNAQDASRDAGRSLGDLSDDARDTGRDMTRALDDAAEDGSDAAQRLEQSFRDSLDAVRSEARTAGDSVSTEMDQGTREASEGVTQLSEEAGANAREVAASFDGSAQSISDGFQGLAAEALGGFGPAGAAAGVGIAAGMGLAMSSMEKAKEQAQETAEEVAELAGVLIDLGDGANARSGDLVNDRLKEMATTAEDGKNELLELRDQADGLGIDFTNMARAMAGDSASATSAIAEITAEMERLGEINNQNYGAAYNTATGRANADRRDTINQLEEQRRAIADVNGMLDEGTEVYGLYNDALVDSESAAEDAAQAQEDLEDATLAVAEATRDAASAALEASNQAIGYAATVASTTETIAANGQTLDLNTEAGRNNQSALNELAGAALGLADANRINGEATDESNAKLVEGRDAFINAATSAGMAADEAEALADKYGLIPETVSTQAQVSGVDQAKADLDEITRERSVKVKPGLDPWEWQTALDNTVFNLRAPLVKVKALFGQENP